MASLNKLYITKAKLEEVTAILNKKGEKGVSLIVELSDEIKTFTTKDGKTIEQDVSAWVEQSEEQRKERKPRFYVGNGKTIWSNTSQAKPQKSEPKKKESDRGINADDSDGLPF